jgi:hypothetical protein
MSVHLAEVFRGEDLNVKSKQMTDDGHQVKAKAHIAFGNVCSKEY